MAPGAVIVAAFGSSPVLHAAQGDLTGVYPSEVFPSEIRSTGVGFAAAVSRIGAAAGTFLLPIGISTIGIGASVLIGAAVCVGGAVIGARDDGPDAHPHQRTWRAHHARIGDRPRLIPGPCAPG